jgi:hypothetical protein
MNQSHLRLYSLTTVLLFILSVIAFARYATVAQETGTSSTKSSDPALKEFANYKQWIRANDIPVPGSLSLVSGATLVGADFLAGG